MYQTIIALLVGLGCGFALRKMNLATPAGKLTELTVIALIFCMGVTLASDATIMNNITELGMTSVVVGLSTLFFSAVAVFTLSRIARK